MTEVMCGLLNRFMVFFKYVFVKVRIHLQSFGLVACRNTLEWQTETQILATDISCQNAILGNFQVTSLLLCVYIN